MMNGLALRRLGHTKSAALHEQAHWLKYGHVKTACSLLLEESLCNWDCIVFM